MTTQIVTLDPISRIEGHLRIDLEIKDKVVVAALSSGTSFRGFEPILVGRDPRDAPHITQRICGVCPVPHARCSTAAFEAAAGIQVNDQARLIRNIIEATNFLDSHLLHFYVLALPDFVSGLPSAGAWPAGQGPRVWENRAGLNVPSLVANYVQSLQSRRECHAMGALLGGKMPHPVGIVPGGATAMVTADMKTQLATCAGNVKHFIETAYQADMNAIVAAFPEYQTIGASGADFLCVGGYPEANGTQLFAPGLFKVAQNALIALDASKIGESVARSRYAYSAPTHPSAGVTRADLTRTEAYSFSKAPRVAGSPCEVGPLARAVVGGRAPAYRGVHARHMSRLSEALLLVGRLADWVNSLTVGAQACPSFPKPPVSGSGVGLVEAPRGSLGHWLTVQNSVIANYQVISPTTWNGSPRDEQALAGPLEKALEGVTLKDEADPIEVHRIIHSFDPCLQCAVH